MAQSITILTSTSAAVTGVIVLDPTARQTSFIFTSTTAAGSSNSTVQVEWSLGDPTLIPLGGPALTWALASSVTAIASSQAVAGLSGSFLGPVGALRINSTSGSTTTTYSFTLQAEQSVTA